jgi:uncharacterized protein YrrD
MDELRPRTDAMAPRNQRTLGQDDRAAVRCRDAQHDGLPRDGEPGGDLRRARRDTTMLHSLTGLRRLRVHAADGDIGEVTDGYFDDERWVVRYLVVNTGSWLRGRSVLISPYSVSHIDESGLAIVTNLTRKQVEDSPSVDMARPISRQQEADYLSYYGYPLYWPYTTLWAWGAMPVVLPPDPRLTEEPRRTEDSRNRETPERADTRLRSCREVTGYHIQGSDHAVGHAEDFLFEHGTWAIRYLAVDTRNWLPGKHVLISTQWIREVSWAERRVVVNLPRSAIEQSPEYDPKHLPSRLYEAELHRHYERPGYWS